MPLNISRSALVKTFALTAVIAPLWAGTALAWTGDDVAKRLQALLKEQMVELTFSKAETNGNNVILHDAKAQIAMPNTSSDETTEKDDKDNAPVNLGTITLSGVSDAADDVYLIEKATFNDVKIVEDNSVFTTSDIRFDKVRLTKEPKNDLLGRMQYAESFHVGALTLTVEGKQVFELTGLNLAQEPFSKEKASNYSWGIKALKVDLEEANRIDLENKKKEAAEMQAAIDEATKAAEEAAEAAETDANNADAATNDKADAGVEADTNADIATDGTDEAAEDNSAEEETVVADTSDMDIETIRALGLEKIQLTMDAKGSWSPYSGDYTVDQMTINGVNIGTYNYKLAMGGYNLKFIKAVQDLFASILEDGGDNTSMQIAAVGMMQNLSISNMEMRYDDADFVGKLLEHEAKKRDMTREALVQEMKDQLQIGVVYFENEPRVVEAVKAVGDFLDKPKSLSLKIQPENPVTFGILTAVGMAEPKKLWSVLGVKVEANQ